MSILTIFKCIFWIIADQITKHMWTLRTTKVRYVISIAINNGIDYCAIRGSINYGVHGMTAIVLEVRYIKTTLCVKDRA